MAHANNRRTVLCLQTQAYTTPGCNYAASCEMSGIKQPVALTCDPEHGSLGRIQHRAAVDFALGALVPG